MKLHGAEVPTTDFEFARSPGGRVSIGESIGRAESDDHRPRFNY